MIDTTIYPRLIEPHLVEALADSPAVLIHGPRQCGKTTLARIVGLLPKLSESLAGRLQTLRLHPLAQCELERRGSDFLDALFANDFAIERAERLGGQLPDRITAGGYPAALARPPGRRRANWYHDHIDALVQRDVRDLARIRQLEILPRLLAAAADQTARLLNASDLAAPFAVSRPTIRDYLTLLERVFLLERTVRRWPTTVPCSASFWKRSCSRCHGSRGR